MGTKDEDKHSGTFQGIGTAISLLMQKIERRREAVARLEKNSTPVAESGEVTGGSPTKGRISADRDDRANSGNVLRMVHAAPRKAGGSRTTIDRCAFGNLETAPRSIRPSITLET